MRRSSRPPLRDRRFSDFGEFEEVATGMREAGGLMIGPGLRPDA
jgi:hypothetical protein